MTTGIGIDGLPIELVEEIARKSTLDTLKNFRLSNRRCSSAGYKPLLRFVPTTITCSNSPSSSGSRPRSLSELVGIASFKSIVNAIASLTVGRGANRLDLFSEVRFPNLTFFRLNQLEIESAQPITAFLTNHANSLKSLEIREVDIICPLAPGAQNETLPAEWRAILRTVRELPHVTELMILDLGYYNQQRDVRYKIWFHQESILENERLRTEASGRYEALIRAKAAQATAKWAVRCIVDAVLRSTGKKVFKFQIAY